MISLATAMHSQPGVYALLLGSGTSTGAGVKTGWGVIQALATKAAAAAAAGPVGDNFDAEAWWDDHGDGSPLGYSGLLSALASTPGARRALLAEFFVPTAEERDQGIKVPGAAHHAIAKLVRRGAIRVIVTTNFDNLIEQALELEGIPFQVIASASAINGMEPLTHAGCTVFKLHGDYTRIDQLNTLEELSTYDEDTKRLLDRVLDEYGLVINGWSADWDHALVEALQGNRSRRYPLFWATYGDLGTAANRLVDQHRAHVITKAAADQFFPDLVVRLDALDHLAAPPLSQAMAVAQLKRALPDPRRHIELRDLLAAQIGSIRSLLDDRTGVPPDNNAQAWQDEHDRIRAASDTLLHLIAHGIYLDRDRQHTDLWVEVIQQLMRAKKQRWEGPYIPEWAALGHYPALLALHTGSLAAIATGHEDVFLQLLRRPMWRDSLDIDNETIALDTLLHWKVLDGDTINSFPRWGNPNRWLHPASKLLRAELQPVLLPLVGDFSSYVQLYDRTEYRIALAHLLFGAGQSYGSEIQIVPGEYLLRGPSHGGGFRHETDFRAHADHAAWGWTPEPDDEFDQFSEILKGWREAFRSAANPRG